MLYRTSLRQFTGLKRSVKKEIIDKLIKFDYKTLHLQHKQHFEIKWEAYRTNDLMHPIFEQKVERTREQRDLEGLNKDFICSLNLLSTRLGCKVCGGTEKISIKHYDKHHSQDVDLKVEKALLETYSKTQQSWLIKKRLQTIRSQNKGERLTEEQIKKIRELKGEKQEIKREIEEKWRGIHINISMLI